MIRCTKCNSAMIRSDYYDPDGMIPLHGCKKHDGYWYACINPNCEIGKKNIWKSHS